MAVMKLLRFRSQARREHDSTLAIRRTFRAQDVTWTPRKEKTVNNNVPLTSTSQPGSLCFHIRFLCLRRCLLAVLLITLISGIIIVASLLGSSEISDPEETTVCSHEFSSERTTASGPSVTPDDVLQIPRSEWGGRNPTEITPLAHPTPYAIIIHTVSQPCSSVPSCSSTLRNIQDYHMDNRHFRDIAYNFLVGGDGRVYEGRGWDAQGNHTRGFNNVSIGLAFIGDFSNVRPTRKQLDAASSILQEGAELGKLDEEYALLGHQQVIATKSPGEELQKIITSWPHWAEAP